MDGLVKDAAPRVRKTLTASPAMRAAVEKLGITPAPAPPPPEAVPIPPPPVDPLEAEARAARKAARRAALARVEAVLSAHFPAVFTRPAVPLAVGIHQAILAAAGDVITPQELERFLRHWTRQPGYLDALAHGEPRRNLDGSPAGEPDEAQRRAAVKQVYGDRSERVWARIEQRRKAAEEAPG